MRSGGPLPVAGVVRLAGQLAEALRAIHRQGIVHRDLKAADVLLADDGVRGTIPALRMTPDGRTTALTVASAGGTLTTGASAGRRHA
ncbi:protein kinase [Streptomyces paradoxus]|uniref:protein kinase n=1 Tax=Streptomyces paradoxus TaxID=66375 RepID=UPI0037015DE8